MRGTLRLSFRRNERNPLEKIATCFLGDRMIVKQNGRNERNPIKGIATFFEFQQHKVIYLDITSFVSSAGR